jgi:hypothetical protein
VIEKLCHKKGILRASERAIVVNTYFWKKAPAIRRMGEKQLYASFARA